MVFEQDEITGPILRFDQEIRNAICTESLPQARYVIVVRESTEGKQLSDIRFHS
jgi:hypothetical protein